MKHVSLFVIAKGFCQDPGGLKFSIQKDTPSAYKEVDIFIVCNKISNLSIN